MLNFLVLHVHIVKDVQYTQIFPHEALRNTCITSIEQEL